MLLLLQGISSEIIRRIKSRSLLRYTSTKPRAPRPVPLSLTVHTQRTQRDTSPRLSCARLMLGLLASRAGRIETAALSGLTDSFAEIHDLLGRGGDMEASLWFEAELWKQAARVPPAHLRDAFVRLLGGPLMTEALAAPLVKLAFQLLSQKPPGGHGTALSGTLGTPWSHLSGANVVCLASPVGGDKADPIGDGGDAQGTETAASSCSSFGAWLTESVFCLCHHARFQIAK